MIWPQLSPCYSRNVLLLVRFSINCESWDFTFFIFVCSETSTVPGPWLPSNRYLLNAWILLFLLFSRDTGVVFFNSRALLYMIGTLYLVLCISISTSYCFLPYRALSNNIFSICFSWPSCKVTLTYLLRRYSGLISHKETVITRSLTTSENSYS